MENIPKCQNCDHNVFSHENPTLYGTYIAYEQNYNSHMDVFMH